MRNRITSLLAAGALFGTQPGAAHHSQAMFDVSRSHSLVGTITEFNWVNPHSSFKVEVKNSGGQSEIWAVEMNSPQNLVRSGWKRTTLKPGDRITAIVRPLRDGKPGGLYVSVTLPDGTVMDGAAAGQGSATGAAAAPAR